tara:strand:- start:120 stop:635 length:516 start_codon:yes stop_codon:yes gene_type:complete
MNYSEKNPTVAFRIEKKLFQKLEREAIQKKITNSEISREIITKYLKLELIENNQTEYDKLKLEKLKEEIRYLKIKNDFAETFDKPLSNSASRMIKPAITNNQELSYQSPYDASSKRLQCVDCGVLITWDSFNSYLLQLPEYKKHILNKHNRELSAIEKDVLDHLKYEGKSK